VLNLANLEPRNLASLCLEFSECSIPKKLEIYPKTTCKKPENHNTIKGSPKAKYTGCDSNKKQLFNLKIVLHIKNACKSFVLAFRLAVNSLIILSDNRLIS
jgi:hypothetical protein